MLIAYIYIDKYYSFTKNSKFLIGGKFAVPRNRGRPRKTQVKSNDGFEEDEEMNDVRVLCLIFYRTTTFKSLKGSLG